jgi:hypothetical protein
MSKKWKIERSFFDKEVMGYDPKTKKDQTWPYYSAEENSHIEWLKTCQDPVTKELYKGKDVIYEYDNEGKEIPSSRKVIEKEPYFITRQIVRIKTREGGEFLYSRGLIYGYSNFGSEVTTSFQEPEVWTQTNFKHKRIFDAKEGRERNICEGPSSSTIHYTLDFSPENVDKLMKNAIPNVMLMVKEEGGIVKQAPDLETFKHKSFEYIRDMGYLTEKERSEKLEEFKAMQEGSKKK